MTSAMVEEWLNIVWRRRPGALLCKYSLLVLDSYRGHLTDSDHQLTPTGHIKRASLSQLAGWVAAAWDDIPGTLIVRSFKKCGISSALHGTEDCALFEDSDKAISDDDSE
ncbi:hypothetical protein HPB52_004302 [Rhipicephalus sanguineus]|uniref:DDE-1 domain-containing protein n=1 Tax=Rhipicephalus sanguineus TaxID=34632 RepID=A0A9D4QGI1_RHISA|nr:hypothetical protein HPB52_004302 [Rhipicephalus sanguineus]